MSIRLTVFAFVYLVISASNVTAQALPITKRVVSQEELAQAVEKDDRTVLNVPCTSYVAAVNQIFPDIAASYGPINSCSELAAYVLQLQEVGCPPQQATLARVMPNGSIDTVGWARQLRSGPDGERCLYDNNRAKWFAPLSCGNLIVTPLPAFYSEKKVEQPKTLADSIENSVRNQEDADRRNTTLNPESRSWLRRHWKPLVGAGVAGVVVAYCVLREPRCFEETITNTNTNRNTISITF